MATENLSLLLETLQLASTKENSASFSDNLEKVINEITIKEDTDRTEKCQEMVKEGILKIVISALKDESKEVQSRGAELVAELAKVESCRLSCVEEGIVPVLVEKMSSEDATIMVQSCRALGNICYEYDGGRSRVMQAGGGTQLLNLLKRAADYSDSPENHQLRLVATGFLLNLLNSYEADEENDPLASLLVDVLFLYLDKFVTNDDIPTHILLSLSCLADTDCTRELVVSRDISSKLIKVLKENNSPEVIETCLELITNLADSECVKMQLSVGGICEAVLTIVKRFIDDDSTELKSAIIKTSTDLIVLILVGDESMSTLYGNGSSSVYLEMIDWLTASSSDLQIAGALAMGNFARNDNHCIQMVKSGVAGKLLQVLRAHNTVDGDLRLQHALLAALRNLSIAKINKPIIIEQNVLEVLLPMVEAITTFPVVFKLLATLRMIIDGQSEAAILVGKSKNVVEQIVKWSLTVEHPGVQGEASRIISWIIKNCDGNTSVIGSLVDAGAIVPLVVMLTSEHTVMVNEAILGLALAFAKSEDSSHLMTRLQDCAFVPKVEEILKRQNLPPEIVGNIVSMLLALTSSGRDDICSFIKTEDIKKGIESYKTNANEVVKALVVQLWQVLNSDEKPDIDA